MAVLASIVVVAAAAGYLVWGSFQESLVYFYTPTEVLAEPAKIDGRKIRLAGQVSPGRIQKGANKLTLTFAISDGTNEIPVSYSGVVPDLFAEGQMAVAEGRHNNGHFQADQIMAKHSEDYDPDEMKYPHVKDRDAKNW